jgi:hypothetical protein
MKNKITRVALFGGALIFLASPSFAQTPDPFKALEQSASDLLKVDPRTATEAQKAEAAAAAPIIRKALVAAIEAHASGEASLSMRTAIPASFSLSSRAEWKDYAAAEAGLKAWLAVLDKHVADPAKRAALALRIGERHISRWMPEKPADAARVMDDFGARYAPAAPDSARLSWYFSQAESERQLRIYAHSSTAETRKRLDQFLGNEGIPISERATMVATIGRSLYSDGEAELASKYLTDFSTAHPEAPRSISFCHAWFYVELIGRGDRAKAAQILSGLEADVAAGKVQAQEGPTNAMRSALQARESLTEDELAKTAAATMAEWRAKKASKEQEAKEQK